MNWKKIIGILVVIAVIGFIGYNVFGASDEESAVAVQTGTTTEETVVETILMTGTLEPGNTQEVFGQGIVSEVPVSVGDTVSEGDDLITYADGTAITANFDGTVTEVEVDDEETDLSIQTGQPAVVLSDLTNLQVSVNLTSSDAPLVEEGQEATLTANNETFSGNVGQIDPVATTTTGQMGGSSTALGAVINFDSAPEGLFAGFEINVEIITNTSENTVALPIEALLYNEDNQPYVFIVEDGEAHAVDVQTGIQSNTLVEILDGLETGQTVILSPSESVSDGLAVTED